MFCYSCSPINTETKTYQFNCGNTSINNSFQNALDAHLLNQSHTYIAHIKDIIIGFYTITVTSISLEKSSSPVAEKYANHHYFGVIKIDALAIDEKFQNSGFGKNLLLFILKQAQQEYDKLPIRLLVLDALSEKVSWYEKRGFRKLFPSLDDTASTTIKMYIDLMPDDKRNEIAEYIQCV